MQQHVSKYFAHRHNLKWSNHISYFESRHIAYQIKGKGAQSTMKEIIMSLHTPSTPELCLSKPVIEMKTIFKDRIAMGHPTS